MFPIRFREELERCFSRKLAETADRTFGEQGAPDARAATSRMAVEPSLRAVRSRIENLLHYLAYGFCLPEWDGPEFDLDEELRYFTDPAHPEHAAKTSFPERLLSLLAANPQALERLLRQADPKIVAEVVLLFPVREDRSDTFRPDHSEASRTDRMVRPRPEAPGESQFFTDPDTSSHPRHSKQDGKLVQDSRPGQEASPFPDALPVPDASPIPDDSIPEELPGWTLLQKAGFVSPQLADAVSILKDALEKDSLATSGRSSASDPVRAQLRRLAGILYREITGQAVPEERSLAYFVTRLLSGVRGRAPFSSESDEPSAVHHPVSNRSAAGEGSPHPLRGESEPSSEAARSKTGDSAPPTGEADKEIVGEVPSSGAKGSETRESTPSLGENDKDNREEALLSGAKRSEMRGSTPLSGNEDRENAFSSKMTEEFPGRKSGEETAAVEEETASFLDFGPLSAWLESTSVRESEKEQRLRDYARRFPARLWEFVGKSSAGIPGWTAIPFRQWGSWVPADTWLEMMAGVSQPRAEILRRAVGIVAGDGGWPESALSESLARFIAGFPADHFRAGEQETVLSAYLDNLSASTGKASVPTLEALLTALHAAEAGMAVKGPEHRQDAVAPLQFEQALEEAVQPEILFVPNAGLCLLSIWFPRLFGILGLLTEDGKDIRDLESRIRAVFILQRLVTAEAREYREQELAFNRILTGCPFYVPLPRTMELSAREIQTVESMLSGVKANWTKLKNTSVKGFQGSFIARPGRLERRMDKWVLFVENRSYDILLDSLPWSYRQIRLPWLKKKVTVVWRDKEEFDFDI